MTCSYSDRETYKAVRGYLRSIITQHIADGREKLPDHYMESLAERWLRDNGLSHMPMDMPDLVGACRYYQIQRRGKDEQ